MCLAINPLFVVYLLCLLWGGLLGRAALKRGQGLVVMAFMLSTMALVLLLGAVLDASVLSRVALCGAVLGGAVVANSGLP